MANTQHPLLQWFTSVGIELHPSLYLEQDPVTGLSFYTSQPFPQDTTVVRVPKELCITSSAALQRVQLLLRELSGSALELDPASLPPPDWILLYLVLSRLAEEYLTSAPEGANKLNYVFTHLPYISHIPKTITTPLHFSTAELALLANTPLVGSTERRLRETIVDYERARSLVLTHLSADSSSDGFAAFLSQVLQPVSLDQLEEDPLMARTFHKALELWRWAESAFTSRSFPPRLIGLSDASQGQPSSNDSALTSAPILIPGYDTFNHARAHPVTWSTSTHGQVCMTLNYVSPAGCQVYNNYGGKSNEEFLSGYGFTLPTCSEDTLALKLGDGSNDTAITGKQTHYWRIPSSATSEVPLHDDEGRFIEPTCPAPGLPDEMIRTCVDHSLGMSSIEIYARIMEVLESMLIHKRKAFRKSQQAFNDLSESQLVQRGEEWDRGETEMVREGVYGDIAQYRKGQLGLLNHAVSWTRDVLEKVAEVLDAEGEEMGGEYEGDC
ncbi:related to RKM1-SET-domain lysine-N-methyltransferase [Sporisorium scitamineum]|uniref:Related to RKM1-SET-domain lysine-N-methyltransferase n=1 Tax=Sporisorium scitamineum TaxID=49012 RepID=A0A0F7S7L8_9BASI|nr:related to RKM1-SET-domain lysine-N-methyltransferase [Sporisorium scitamineum]CDW96885.1 hypothetical protein [Sporisorium scitamineum]